MGLGKIGHGEIGDECGPVFFFLEGGKTGVCIKIGGGESGGYTGVGMVLTVWMFRLLRLNVGSG